MWEASAADGVDVANADVTDALAPIPMVGYAVGEHAERHRRIMRVFYLNKTRDIGLPLTQAQLQSRLRVEFGYEVALDSLESSLGTLAANGALRPDQDMRDVASAPEFRRKSAIYDITPAAELFEQFLIAYNGLRDEIGELDATRLLAIRDALGRIAGQLCADEPDDAQAGEDLRLAAQATADLRQGATSYMSRLNEFTVSSAHSIEEFEAARDGIVTYLQGFHQDLRRYDEAIASHLRSIASHGPMRLAERVVATRALPAPMAGITEQQIHDRAVSDELARWQAIEGWFGTIDDGDAPWRRLTHRVLDAVMVLIDIARRKIERGHDRRDRGHAWQRLAVLFQDADDRAVRASFARAVGMRPARHFGVLFGDHENLGRPQNVSWAGATPVIIAAHMRQPGVRRPGAGRPASIPVNRGLATRKRAEAERERALRARLRDALAGADGSLRMSALHTLDPVELADLMTWISRAFAAERLPDGSRQASSPDGKMTLRLVLPADGARARVRADHGSLDCPDYRIEVAR